MLHTTNIDCMVFLTGQLTAMPFSLKNNPHEILVEVTRKRLYQKPFCSAQENHQVIISREDAAKILEYGYLNMILTIRGDLRSHPKAVVVADTVEFCILSGSAQHAHLPNFRITDSWRSYTSRLH